MARKAMIKKLPENLAQGAEIFEGENGKEAVFLHNTMKPDVIFLDLTMPVMDGYEALEQIMAKDPEAKIIIVTADIQPKAKERVMELGAKSYITKDSDAARVKEVCDSLQIG